MPSLKFQKVWAAARKWQSENPDKPFVAFMYGDNPYRNPRIESFARIRADGLGVGYRPPRGEPKVLTVIARDLERLGIPGADPEKNICVTNGVLEGLNLITTVLLNPGDEVIVPAPYYFYFPDQVALSQGRMVVVKTSVDGGFKITPEQLEAAITRQTRLFYLNTPLNPAGTFYLRQELRGLADVLVRHDHVYTACDEVYERVYLDGDQHYSLLSVAPELSHRIIVCNSLAKSTGLSELRAGWMVGPADFIELAARVKGPRSWATNIPAQEAILAALSDQEIFEAEVAAMRAKLRSGRNLMLDRLTGMGIETLRASAGIFLFPRVPEGLTIPELGIEGESEMSPTERFAYGLIPYGTTVVPSDDSGFSGHFRLTYGLPEEDINRGMDYLRRAKEGLS